MLPTDSTKKFSEVFDNATKFLNEWKASALYEENLIKDENVTKTFYLI